MAINFPSRPSENSDPWYRARETYDQALEAGINQVDRKIDDLESNTVNQRGTIPSGSDLNDFYGPDYRGIWRFASGTQMENAPFNSATSGVLEVISEGLTGENSTKQVFTNQNSSYWREANIASDGRWGDWYKYASGQDLEDDINTTKSELESQINQVDRNIALPTRGTIPSGSDLNDFYGPDYRGIWRFGSATQMENAPFNSATAGVLEVISESSNSTKQVYTNQNSSYWREANIASDGSWGDWYKYVSEEDLEDGVALPSRGIIPSGSDLNDFFGPDYKGAWRFGSLTEMENAPFNSGTAGVFEVISQASNATKQVFTNQNLSYWRESFLADDGEWGDWHKYVSLSDLADHSSASNLQTGYVTPNDGGVLYLIDRNHVQTDWTEDPIASGEVEVIWDDQEIEYVARRDGRGQLVNTDPSARTAMIWNHFGDLENVTLTSAIRVETAWGSYGGAVVARASGDANNKQGVLAGVNWIAGQAWLRLYQFEANEPVGLSSKEIPLSTGLEYYLKLKVEGPVCSLKYWYFPNSEPQEWDLVAETTILDPGRVGYYAFSSIMHYRALEVDAR